MIGDRFGPLQICDVTGATIHAVRVLMAGSGSDADVIEGIDWAANHAATNGWMGLGNMSLGGSPSDDLDRAVCAAWEGGFAFAVAAGNEDESACGHSPARGIQAVDHENAISESMAFFVYDWLRNDTVVGTLGVEYASEQVTKSILPLNTQLAVTVISNICHGWCPAQYFNDAGIDEVIL